MDLNRYTEKAQEALLQAQSLAGEYSHGQLEGEHLLLSLLRQSDGVVPQIAQGLGLQPGLIAQQLEGELSRKPGLWCCTGRPVAGDAADAGASGEAWPGDAR
jgi:ATP-dependent Clp protease ATP-binding subunit ClpB